MNFGASQYGLRITGSLIELPLNRNELDFWFQGSPLNNINNSLDFDCFFMGSPLIENQQLTDKRLFFDVSEAGLTAMEFIEDGVTDTFKLNYASASITAKQFIEG